MVLVYKVFTYSNNYAAVLILTYLSTSKLHTAAVISGLGTSIKLGYIIDVVKLSLKQSTSAVALS